MKIRNGFISNSSSTSFVLAFKGKELTDQMIIKALSFDLKVNYESPLYSFIVALAETIIDLSDPIDEAIEDLNEYEKEFVNFIDDLKEKGFTVYYGHAESSSDELCEMCLYEYNFDIDTDNLILTKDNM